MSIISNILATIPAAPAGGTREVNIQRSFLSGIDTVIVTATYKYTDGSNISITDSFPDVMSDANLMANSLTSLATRVTYTINLLTV